MRLTLLVSIVAALLVGCADYQVQQQLDKEFNEWNTTAWPLVESGKLKHSEYFGQAEEIAKKYNFQGGVENCFYLKEQALRMEQGQISKDALYYIRDKLTANDQNMRIAAHAYYLRRTRYEPMCSSFGYSPNTPEFNKCIYEVAMREFAMQQQMMQTIMNSRPILVVPQSQPAYRAPTTTNCHTDYLGNVTCTTN